MQLLLLPESFRIPERGNVGKFFVGNRGGGLLEINNVWVFNCTRNKLASIFTVLGISKYV